ncbi:MAG: penicillin-binding protein 1A [Rhodospirillales bacterium]|nr:penicillin-binding protein 1A [Rhodospirillales bacterium]
MKIAGIVLGSLVLLAALAGGAIAFVFFHYGRDLPDHNQLAAYEPPVMTRVHAGDGRLLAEHAREKRLFVPVGAMPERVIQAFLAAEDKSFYEHFGVDPISVANAVVTNLVNMAGSGDRRPIGASTVTQQVAKNFLLSGELSFSRKIKEAILAMRIEDAFTKDRILELYLNEIYLGAGSYGVAAAALNYFDRSLNDLSLEEIAYLAALPKAPNNYHPVRKHEAAVARRNWVLGQMVANGAASEAEAEAAMQAPLRTRDRAHETFVEAPHFAEEVRRWLQARYGDDTLYEGGLSVRTTVDPALQAIADRALRGGLVAYDQRRGWRGPLAQIDPAGDWRQALGADELPPVPAPWRLAAVLTADARRAEIGFADGAVGAIALDDLTWARKARGKGRLGPEVSAVHQVLSAGDVVPVEPADGRDGAFALRQIPAVSGALVALDPHTGRVLALVGGFDFGTSEFDRATQARRQPGSAFKPFVYLAALDHGYTPASIVLDAPVVIDQGEHLRKWKPENYTERFYGPSTLRVGLEESRNLMTLRVAQDIGMKTVGDYAARFGLYQDLPELPSAALGSMETTPLDLAAAYAMLVNGGRKIEPAFVERIQDRNGRTVYRRDARDCDRCRPGEWHHQLPPILRDVRPVIADPRTTYQVVSMLEGAVQRGTGRALRKLGASIGGKTGTTNEFRDAWFVGFTPDLVAAAYVGFDQPQSLGRKESGGRVSAPIVRDFFAGALVDKPAVPFRVPPGIRFVRVERGSGALPGPASDDVIVEAFLPGTEPTQRAALRAAEGLDGGLEAGTVPFEGLGAVY